MYSISSSCQIVSKNNTLNVFSYFFQMQEFYCTFNVVD